MRGRVKKKLVGRSRRKARVRKHVFGTAARPRLNVFRSAQHIYAQVIDDEAGNTLAAASTLGKEGVDRSQGDKSAHAQGVGKKLAALCLQKEIRAVVFDRNGYRYHGRVRAVAEAAREGGLQF
ncbi:MAG: 50S ribosomal protein L18 [Deltaproteobacteria bacterium]|nr:MAG: 50S ribosomal protein L18 [Deltaproteobacteria bacterium]